ncbi:MAG: DHH family phosphoesterase [Candidatus Electrothrix aestuarii]|uniref:DHH family phosphoesterase n=1 Tax=Candidatus Electrothrix aestuarii TaxID=3062594 RepID=A0AAU8LXQ5_9BACT|nr:DHH family phosphoesterase [Candidatus Electrothrix aestuarii]
MNFLDVFNGDADGICALHQLRLQEPRPDARLLSGVKRDISLLEQVREVRETAVTVLDISLDKNRESLEEILAAGNTVFYADHHYAGEIPASERLSAHIDPDPLICTSLIVNRLLEGKYTLWAIAGAFGDNLDESAEQLAQEQGLDQVALAQLKETGILLNYNGYGASLEDLFFHPVDLFRQVQPYANPLDFYADAPALQTLKEGYQSDMEQALSFEPVHQDSAGRIYQLPAEAWARRVAGVYSNTLARQEPELAHALLTENADKSLRISIRAPLNNRNGADLLCRQFPTGGGRAAAAGINALPADQLDPFIRAFSAQFSSFDTV